MKINEMPANEIKFYDPASGEIKIEEVYGEPFLRWAYETNLGQLTVSAVVKRALFSQWYGWRMDRPASASRILPFIEDYQLDASEFLESPTDFKTFNAFFSRRLRPDARLIDADPKALVYPADGRHLAFADVDRADAFYVKGQRFSLHKFVGDPALAEKFSGGSLLISRLCPVDYHRFHFPFHGRPSPAQCLPGSLRSVSPIALRRRLSILWENRRVRTSLETDALGEVLMFEIGATCVGRVHQTFEPQVSVAKGAPKGYFEFGGSCVALLFQPKAITLDSMLLKNSARSMETYGKMGQVFAQIAE